MQSAPSFSDNTVVCPQGQSQRARLRVRRAHGASRAAASALQRLVAEQFDAEAATGPRRSATRSRGCGSRRRRDRAGSGRRARPRAIGCVALASDARPPREARRSARPRCRRADRRGRRGLPARTAAARHSIVRAALEHVGDDIGAVQAHQDVAAVADAPVDEGEVLDARRRAST